MTPKRACVAACLAAGVLSGAFAPIARAQRSLEYEVKGGFIAHFLKFIQWPAAALGPSGSPFPLCVLAPDPFGPALDRTIGADPVAGHPIAVRRLREPADLSDCRLVFIPSAAEARAVRALRARAPSALFIGETPRFLDDGGHINFVIEAGRVRFDLNVTAAKESGLIVSSKLARVARRTIGEPGGQ